MEENTFMDTENQIEVKPEVVIEKKMKKKFNIRIAIDTLLFVLIVALFILHFVEKSKNTQTTSFGTPVVYTNPEGTGEIVYINVDTINLHYELVTILTDDIATEKTKQEAIFANRQRALEAKAAQFQRNYESGTLSNIQVQNAQTQLMKESEELQKEYETVATNLQMRQMTALQQINDSLKKAVARVNAIRNASFVFSYQYSGELIYADPAKDITREVLDELNKVHKKSSKK
jgi:outer membrane protein